MKVIPFLTVLVLCVTGCGNHSAIDEQKVVGSWQTDVPSKLSQVFAFRADHTYSIGDPNNPRIQTMTFGYWRLDGNHLTTDMRIVATNVAMGFGRSGMTNEERALIKSSVTVRISSITDSTMVWRDSLHFDGLTLKKVSQ
jgi:hypothetical protein